MGESVMTHPKMRAILFEQPLQVRYLGHIVMKQSQWPFKIYRGRRWTCNTISVRVRPYG